MKSPIVSKLLIPIHHESLAVSNMFIQTKFKRIAILWIVLDESTLTRTSSVQDERVAL